MSHKASISTTQAEYIPWERHPAAEELPKGTAFKTVYLNVGMVIYVLLCAGGIVLADRYTTANAVHQCSKLEEAQWPVFLDWLFDLEYARIGLPAPDAVFFLDMKPEVSQKLMTGRYHGEEAKKDIHEKDVAYLTRSRTAALYCTERLGWQHVRCDDGAEPLPIPQIHETILNRVLELL